MSKPKNYEMNFKEFYVSFYELPPEHMFIITRLLVYMEHVNDPNFGKENYRDSINFLKDMANLTILEISRIIGKKYNYSEDDIIYCLKESVKSAIRRTSRNSSYFTDILEVLNTDEFELELLSDYYNNDKKYGDLKWLYESISDRDKHIIHYLIDDLLILSSSQKENEKYTDDCEEFE